jgi:hypothetical protein
MESALAHRDGHGPVARGHGRQPYGLPRAVEERTVKRGELYVADAVFLCGTAAEVTP